jgi:predicted DNA-binding protein (UPF0251 family)
MVGLSDADSKNSVEGLSKHLLVGLSDANAEKWSTLLNQIASAKLGSALPRKRSTTPNFKTVTRLSQRHKHLDEGETARMIAAYQAGSSVYELAEHFGCHRETVSRRLKSRGVQMRHLAVTTKQIDTAEHLYASGLSLAEVGTQMRIDPSTVWRRLRARGAAIRPPCIHPVSSAPIRD